MKLCIGNTPVTSLCVRKLDVDTNDATIVASDMQSGMTAYAKGQKITGTGKSFSFAFYGKQSTNFAIPIPDTINIIEVSCVSHAFQALIDINEMKNIDFSIGQTLGNLIVDGVSYPVTTSISDNKLTLTCSLTIQLQLFYGKDDHT